MKGAYLSSATLLLAVLSCGGHVVECFQEQKPMSARIVTQLSDLAGKQAWKDVSIDLVMPSKAGAPTKVEKVSAMALTYQRTPLTQGFDLAIIPNRYSGLVHLVRGYQTFYIADGDELWACSVSPGQVILSRSYSRVRIPSSPELAIASFVPEFGEEKLRQADEKHALVSLRPGVPARFFRLGSDPDYSVPGRLTVAAIDFADRTLRLDLVSDGKVYKGTFWIDLDAQKLMRSVLDGKEVFRAK